MLAGMAVNGVSPFFQRTGWLLLSGLALATPRVVAADSLGDTLGPREIAVGEAMRGGPVGASSAVLNPAGIVLNRELVFEAGFGYRPDDSANLFQASACDSTAGFPGCFFYNYIGSDNVDVATGTATRASAHAAGLSSGRYVAQRVALGVTARYLFADPGIAGTKASKGFNWDAGVLFRLSDGLNLGLAGYNLWGTKASQFPRGLGAGAQLRPMPSLTVSFDARWHLDGETKTGRYGGGAEYFLSPGNGQTGYPIRAGVMYDRAQDATYVSGGLGLATLKIGLDLAARRMVKGGDDWLFIASLRIYGPRMAAGEPFAQGQ